MLLAHLLSGLDYIDISERRVDVFYDVSVISFAFFSIGMIKKNGLFVEGIRCAKIFYFEGRYFICAVVIPSWVWAELLL